MSAILFLKDSWFSDNFCGKPSFPTKERVKFCQILCGTLWKISILQNFQRVMQSQEQACLL